MLRSPTGTVGVLGNDTHPQPFLAFSHGDLVWGNEFPTARFGQGAFQIAVRATYEEASGRKLEATTFGKPQRLTYEYADALLKEKLAEQNGRADELVSVWMVGDNPASDIAGTFHPSRRSMSRHLIALLRFLFQQVQTGSTGNPLWYVGMCGYVQIECPD